ncbi:MAG TPA: sugar-transfer associated ATP-grasp domain-containing protein [Candidatus Krumholzibacteria bacterium]|nr:sugar-transfer associated ATP-grasp domain-containing protein [Candidatus Krumholzibacteria bacterium]
MIRAAGAAVRTAKEVKGRCGVPLNRQFRDMIGLKLTTHLGPADYFRYALFDRERVPDRTAAATFGGWRLFEEFLHYSKPEVRGLTHKHPLYRLLASFGLPVPGIRRIYAPTPDCFERNRALATPEQLGHWLLTTDALPVFGKPSNASAGWGAQAITGRRGDGTLEFLDGTTSTVDETVARIDGFARRNGTYLLCELLEQREDMRALCGRCVASLRIVMLVRHGEPEVFRTVILLPTRGQQTSNCRHMATGTVLGRVDPGTGAISRVIRREGPFFEYSPRHPETGAQLDGHVIEGWDEVLGLMHRAALAMAPFRMQHWDVALTTRGPVLMEMNVHGDEGGLQLHGPPGALDEQYLSFAREHRVW